MTIPTPSEQSTINRFGIGDSERDRTFQEIAAELEKETA